MTGTVIIACRVLEDELGMVFKELGYSYPCIWVPQGLHNTPELLHIRLQEILDSISYAERILLCMGFCGNAVLGIQNGSCELVMPKTDDCISLLLGSRERRQALMGEAGTYFLTRGWIQGGRTMWNEYEHLKTRCKAGRARLLLKEMMKNYSRIAILDTGAYELREVEKEAEKIADLLELKCQRVPGTIAALKELISGPWPKERFVTFQPGMKITEEACYGSRVTAALGMLPAQNEQ